jgi:hypothetical protein
VVPVLLVIAARRFVVAVEVGTSGAMGGHAEKEKRRNDYRYERQHYAPAVGGRGNHVRLSIGLEAVLWGDRF